MGLSDFIQLGLGAGLACLGWFARQLWTAVNELKTDINNIKVDIGTNYVRYDRLKDAMEPIMSALAEIKDTLKTKADK